MRPVVAHGFPLAEALRAYEEAAKEHACGKTVLTIN
jgi:NADPH:quinone reductase-like Zn-dependent oxidoreductase